MNKETLYAVAYRFGSDPMPRFTRRGDKRNVFFTTQQPAILSRDEAEEFMAQCERFARDTLKWLVVKFALVPAHDIVKVRKP